MNVNGNGYNYVGWNWLAGASFIKHRWKYKLTVSANTTAGFVSIITLQESGTRFTVGHGLGAAPKMFIM